MPHKSRNKLEEDSTRNRIILAAGPIFAAKGFKKTTVREICDFAKVNVASINYYFGDKQRLYIETVVGAREMLAKQFPQQPSDPNRPPEERLRILIGTLLKRLVAMQSEPWQVRLIMREVLQPTEAAKHLVKAYFRPFFDSILNVIDDLVGARLPDFERNQIGFSVIGQCMHYRFSAEMISMMVSDSEFEENYQIEQLTDHITSFSLGAIATIKTNGTLRSTDGITG
jgi:AcrR family transcriptional regulator